MNLDVREIFCGEPYDINSAVETVDPLVAEVSNLIGWISAWQAGVGLELVQCRIADSNEML